MPVNAVIFSDGRRGIRNTERVLAPNNNVTAWCDRKVEGTELQISHFHERNIRRSESNARMVLSPSLPGPLPDARKSLPSCPNAKLRGNGTTWGGRTCSPALLSSRVKARASRTCDEESHVSLGR